jgi:hypothetical protein
VACSTYGGTRGAYWVSMGGNCVKDTTWDDNIKTDRHETGWEARTGLIWLRKGTGGGRL